MILYMAGIYTGNAGLHSQIFGRFTDIEKRARLNVSHILESYHYVSKRSAVDAMRRDKVRVFLDSGAFSAFTKGVDIDLPAYCEYIQTNADIISVASVLDGIGDPLKTYQNQLAMEALGTCPLPCFHYGEDERYLKYYLEHYEYITLGGMVPISKPQLRLWLDRIWSEYLVDGQGLPRLKVHGFGLTRIEFMERYPWFSVDSSSWVQSAATGGIMIPGIGTIYMSKDSPSRKEEGSKHITTLLPQEARVILNEIERRGFDQQRLQDRYEARWAFNMLTYTELNRPDKAPSPLNLRQPTLF